LVEVTPFYGISLSNKLDRFFAHVSFQFCAEQWAYNYLENGGSESCKILKEAEAFWQNKLEAEANSEAINFISDQLYPELEAEANSKATNFIRSWKRKQKIPRVKKRKRTRKHNTSRGVGSGSKKYSTASTSLLTMHYW